ncbi:RNA recognition motif domain-containing protein [Synechococcus sp. H65.1]|uniref:RNA recognition motif domain-containing protein n=1 Tax=unclassified Synechococcus TaxID=2626047 RepID=UPI0039C4ABFE
MTIFVGNLSFKASEEDLRRVFAEYGTVKQIKMPVDRETGRKRGFAFVELENEADEQKAIEELDGATWMGRDLRVNKALPRQVSTSSSRGNRSARF